MSKHTIKAYAPFGLKLDAIECVITFTHTKCRPAVMYGTPTPADPEEVDYHSVKCAHPLDEAMQKMLEEWAVEYLASDDGFSDACEAVAWDDYDAREYAAELRADR